MIQKIFLFLIIASALSFGATNPASSAAACRSESGGYCVNLAAVVPGLEFLGGTPADTGGLIARLFVFGLGLVGISALIMFVFAGVVYMTAGDSQSRVNQAKSMMGNAVFGLVLALVSYLILYTINPDIVTKGFPNPTKISPAPKISPPQGGSPPSAQNTCSRTQKLINGRCYEFVTTRPCVPPELYNDVGGGCSLK